MNKYLWVLLLPACTFWIEPSGVTNVATDLESQYQAAADLAAGCLTKHEGRPIHIQADAFVITIYNNVYEVFGVPTYSHSLPPNQIFATKETYDNCTTDNIATTFVAYEFVRLYVINVYKDFEKTHPCFQEMLSEIDIAEKTIGLVCNNMRYIRRS